MLYKKNQEKVLSDELFKDPTSEYRGTPFWSWNCKMTPETLTKQIEYLRDMGFGGFHIHSRDGMDNAYLSEEFMNLVKQCVKKARSEDMLAWLYDEDRWPSGAAGGLVTKEPCYRARRLIFAPVEKIRLSSKKYPSHFFEDGPDCVNMQGETSKKEAIRDGKPYFVAAYDIILDENGYLKSYKKIDRTKKAIGSKWLAFCSTQPMSDWYNGYTYLDTLSKKAVKKFIETTHEAYKASVGDEFDKTIPAIFTDEPQFTAEVTLSFPSEKKVCLLPWTPDLPESYKKCYGTDIIEHLPELIWDLGNSRISPDRYRFRDHICQRFYEAFVLSCGKWCEKNSVKLTGHMMAEPTLHSQAQFIGEAMRAYKSFGYPGIDILCNRMELTTAKQAQSVVHQYAKEAMLSELYGVTNWDFDFRGHKFQGDWQAALGVTVRVPHLSWVSMKGNSKRDYPASINYQSPWYKEYPYIEDHFARLNTALTRGKPDVSIGVIHPIESYWLYCGPKQTTSDMRNQLQSDFENLTNWLLFSQLDFDYISESLFPDACKKAANPIAVGKMKYSTLIVPPIKTMRRTTLERLSDFRDAGGHLIFLGPCPEYVDAAECGDIRELYERSTVLPFERFALIKELESERKLEIRAANGELTDNYIYQMRKDGAYKWLFIANACKYNLADVVLPKKLILKIKGNFTPMLYDTLSGEIKDISYNCRNEYTYIELSAYLHDSFLLRLEKAKSKSLKTDSERYESIGSLDYKTKVEYLREEPNVLVLDMAEYSYDDMTEFMPLEEIIRIDGKVREILGLPSKQAQQKQPWVLKPEKPTHKVTLRFTFDCETNVTGAKFATEDPEISTILYDGKEISNTVVGYFVDEAIKTVSLPDITPGRHTITLTMPIAPRISLENCFITGDFNVRLEGCEKTITAPTKKIGFGSITSQGLPFYGGNIVYSCPVDVPEDNAVLKIHSSFYRGALISVKLDGKDVGKIVFAPYNLIVDGVSKGSHTLEITLYGNRYNCFAALHNAETHLFGARPHTYFTRGDAFSYEYMLRDLGIISSPTVEILKKKDK